MLSTEEYSGFTVSVWYNLDIPPILRVYLCMYILILNEIPDLIGQLQVVQSLISPVYSTNTTCDSTGCH